MTESQHEDDKTQTHTILVQGTMVRQFRIVDKIGAGGMGEVYLAEDTKLQRKIALKTLSPHLTADSDSKIRFQREATAAAALNHPNIITVYEVGDFQGRLYIAMEFVEGESLNESIGKGELSFAQIADIGSQIADGLCAAHKAGVIHRDIKPSNIMINSEGRVKIVDFGLAKRSEDAEITRTGSTIGTFAYMSPEQLQGKAADHRSDLFSVGAVIYELTSGHRAFTGAHFAEIAHNIIDGSPSALDQYRRDIPFELLHLLSKCLEKDPDLRYQSSKELLADLRRLDRELKGSPDPILTQEHVVVHRKQSIGLDENRPIIPALPPLPPMKSLIPLAVVSILAVMSLVIWPPAELRMLESVKVDASEAEEIARQFLGDMEFSIFGFDFSTSPDADRDLPAVIKYKNISRPEQDMLETYRPVFQYQTIAAGADRHQRYYVQTNSGGRVFAFRQEMHPDLSPDSISSDSAAGLARYYLESVLGFKPDEFQSETMTETIIDGRVIRQYRWQKETPLPGGAKAYANIWLAGPLLIQASPTLEFPQALTRTVEDRVDWVPIIGFSLFAIMLSFAIGTCLIKRWFVMPGVRFFAIIAAAIFISYLTVEEFLRRSYIQGGMSDVFQSLALAVFLVVPALAVLICACWGIIYGTLRATNPESMPGLGGLLRARIPKAVWARSAAIGLCMGAVTTTIFKYGIWLDSLITGSESQGFEVAASVASISGQLSGLIFEIIISPLVLGAGMTAIMVLRQKSHLGRLVWPISLIIGTMLAVFFGGGSYLGTVGYITLAIMVSLVLYTGFRFGLLAGSIVWFSMPMLEMVVELANGSLLTFRLMGAFYLFIWFLALVFSFYFIFKNRRPLLRQSMI